MAVAHATDDVDWLECISAIETDQGLLYFCDAAYGESNKLHSRSLRTEFPESTHLYSITGYNPFNKVTDRVVNELANNELLRELKDLLPGCRIYNNFSYFPSRPYHFERGFTVQVPQDYRIRNHGMIIYSLAVKYCQAAFFKGIVQTGGCMVPYVVLVQGIYTEIKEELVAISRISLHPAFLHKSNYAIFRDLHEVTSLLHQARHQNPMCEVLLDVFNNNFEPLNMESRKYPIISVEGKNSSAVAFKLSSMLDADFHGNTPACLKGMKCHFKCSNTLLAAFKTLADYIQASLIAKHSQSNIVVVNKYWVNTAARAIINEVNLGQSNLPPKHHEAYRWPDGLLRPDTVIVTDNRCSAGSVPRNQQHKLKASIIKRMKEDSWIVLGPSGSRRLEQMVPLIVDRLKQSGLFAVKSVDAFCPASDMPSNLAALATSMGSIATNLPDSFAALSAFVDCTAPNVPDNIELAENRDEKPFWF